MSTDSVFTQGSPDFGNSPLIGGTLSRPYEQFPRVFPGQIWRDHPYLLPCLTVACCFAVAFLVTLEVFKEVTQFLLALQGSSHH